MVRSIFALFLLTNACAARRQGLAFVPSNPNAARVNLPSAAALGYTNDRDNAQGGDDKSTKGEAAVSKIDNEWGIPDSKTLEPLSPVPLDKLPNGGEITLVGSGPGDPDLLTVSAYRLLRDPDVMVISDRLVSEEILDVIASSDVKIARKLPGCAEFAQEEIYAWTHEGLKAGKHVVRLKIGDPFVFGRGGEEVLKFRRFGVEPTVIPGVSAAFSAPLLGSIPVTHRGVSNQVVMCTGYGRNGTSPDLIRYHKEQTIVFLMAVGRLGELCDRLINMAGYPSTTPVAIVERAGCPDQRTVVGNMETIAELAKQHNVKPPSTIIVGDVVNVLLDEDEVSGQTVTGLIQNYTAAAV